MRYLLLTSILLFLACSQRGEKKEKESQEVLRGVRITETRLGKKSWELFARRVEEFRDTARVYDFVLYFYDEKGSKTSELWADSGVVFQDKGDMKALGKVRVYTREGDTLYTTSLRWMEREKKIISESPVEIHSRGRVLYGKGLISDARLSNVEILGKIRGKSE
ncbi:MAG: LPS export ABC transporter periplasmic protein LptC [Candidatus Hydrothermae bacterium]|nr:LPS export ABC transporter periplasmic protein LptC [Candidatus Hydrothermae bacterium]